MFTNSDRLINDTPRALVAIKMVKHRSQSASLLKMQIYKQVDYPKLLSAHKGLGSCHFQKEGFPYLLCPQRFTPPAHTCPQCRFICFYLSITEVYLSSCLSTNDIYFSFCDITAVSTIKVWLDFCDSFHDMLNLSRSAIYP